MVHPSRVVPAWRKRWNWVGGHYAAVEAAPEPEVSEVSDEDEDAAQPPRRGGGGHRKRHRR